MVHLTFIGDISLDKPLLKAAKYKGKSDYDFSKVFHTEDVFSNSDLVIGNLETCFGGGNKFNKKPYHYNSPDSFCQAIKNAGIGLVSTANNHSMDEGVSGLQRTARLLEACGIEYTGTFAEDTTNRFLLKEINGIKIAFYSLTYSVNKCKESIACNDLYRYVNLTGFTKEESSKVGILLKYSLKPKIKQIVKRLQHESTLGTHSDLFRVEQINQVWMSDIERQIHIAREKSDFLVILLHSGGQFNIEPGDYSKYITDWLCNQGADVIVGNHSHTIQRIEKHGRTLVAYSLGGYCMSVSGEYLVHDCLPEYSLAMHVIIDDALDVHGYIDILKGKEDANGYLSISKADNCDHNIDKIMERGIEL